MTDKANTANVTITRKAYDALVADRETLQALYAGGVDAWEWYSESLREAGLLDDEEEENDDE